MASDNNRMDQICRSPRDREIWMTAEAHAITRWQNKVAKLWADAVTVRSSIRYAQSRLAEEHPKIATTIRDALAAADRLASFVREHSGPKSGGQLDPIDPKEIEP